jgi:hypothetical protein
VSCDSRPCWSAWICVEDGRQEIGLWVADKSSPDEDRSSVPCSFVEVDIVL